MAVDLTMPVLIVDDVKTMVRIVRALLEQIGFTSIDEAHDGATAIDMIGKGRYGLVISDLNMQPMSGYDLLKRLRQEPGLSRTPFMMITADSKVDNVIAAKKAGVDSYVVKPFNAAMLKAKIDTLFGEAR